MKAKPWGSALLAAFLVNICTLVGVLFVVPVSLLRRKASQETVDCVLHLAIPSFACGALVATAVFLILPEAFHLISGGHGDHEDEHDDHRRRLENSEQDVAWKFGASILGGYFLPFLLAGLFPNHPHSPDDGEDLKLVETKSADSTDINISGAKDGMVAGQVVDLEEEEVESDSDDPYIAASKPSISTRVEEQNKALDDTEIVADELQHAIVGTRQPYDLSMASSILAGDFFHNFADGVFIGTAFLLCSRDLAIVVTAATVFHELAQELADFFLLTNQCRLPIWMALTLNFASGFSVMLGVVIIFAIDVSNEVVGILLGTSAGVYFYVAFTETAPRINTVLTTFGRRLTSFLFWVIGTIPIGLVLLNHQHCD